MSGRSHVTNPISLTVNGTMHRLEVPARTTLVGLLRSRLGLTGTKIACDGGECGACTVLVDGEPLLACLVLAVELDGCEVTTIEDENDERIGALRRSFVTNAALQCGYCTPGMIVAASRLPAEASREAIRAELAGNLCRCTGYTKIVDAVERVLRREQRDGRAR
jgi:aerobic-type carbon monoxide dehydrogenase small subunit (CoxS/CutS family)